MKLKWKKTKLDDDLLNKLNCYYSNNIGKIYFEIETNANCNGYFCWLIKDRQYANILETKILKFAKSACQEFVDIIEKYNGK